MSDRARLLLANEYEREGGTIACAAKGIRDGSSERLLEIRLSLRAIDKALEDAGVREVGGDVLQRAWDAIDTLPPIIFSADEASALTAALTKAD